MFRRRRRNEELDEEIGAHLEMETQRRIDAGEPVESARTGARRDFGNVELVKEVTRDAWGWRVLETLLQDARYGVRGLRRSPVFTTVAVLSLALGIGANTAVLSVLNAVSWKPLPVADPHRLVQIGTVEREGGRTRAFPSKLLPQLGGLREVFADIAARSDFDGIALGFEGHTERAVAEVVTARYFAVLGVSPYRGRFFSEGSDDGRWDPAVVLSYELFRRRFQANDDILGDVVHLNGYPFTVIGVAPPGFCGLRIGETPDLWLPAMLEPRAQKRLLPAMAILNAEPGNGITPIARLGPGVPRERAEAAADVLFQRWRSANAGASIVRGPARVRLEDAARANNRVDHLAWPLTIGLGITGLVVMVTCVNLASLLLARSAARRREMATRMAIGAGRARLLRQLAVESLVLAAGGGLLGIALAHGGAAGLRALLLPSGSITSFLDVSPDGRVLACAAAVSLATVVLFALVPALRASRPDLAAALKPDSGCARGGRLTFGHILIAAEMALVLVLVAAAGLFVRSLRHLQAADPHTAEQVLMLSLKPVRDGGVRYPPGRLESFFPELEQRVSALPGVAAVSLISGKPGSAVPRIMRLERREPRAVRVEREDGSSIAANIPIAEGVTAGFFPMFGITATRGRVFTDGDHGRRVMVVSEALARDVFGTGDPLGRRVRVHRRQSWAEPWKIVGVVAGTAWDGPEAPATRLCFIPFVQPGLGMYDGDISTLLVKTAGPTSGALDAVRREIQAMDGDLPVFNVRTVAAEIDRGRSQERLLALLSGLMGALAAVLAAIGLYGVIAYAVARRTREIGIRVALGAPRGSVVWMVLGDTLRLVAIGVAAGVPLALMGGRLIAAHLHGVPAHDPAVLLGSLACLTAAGLAAGWLPARRAAAVKPAVALREE